MLPVPDSNIKTAAVDLSRSAPLAMKHTLLACVHGAGRILLDYFGQVTNPRAKENAESIVCDADLAADKFILEEIRGAFPGHNVLSEESGWSDRSSEYTWVIDPLDGTSNFVMGIPWFGVQIAVLREAQPILAAMFLPLENTLYFSEPGLGTLRNGRKVTVTPEKDLRNVLCAFGFDSATEKRTRDRVDLFHRILRGVRNTRGTYSLVDFCFTMDGRFGGFVCLKTKIWDIAPVALMLPEAGGQFTGLDGKEIVFQLDPQSSERDYAVVGASPTLHAALFQLIGKPS